MRRYANSSFLRFIGDTDERQDENSSIHASTWLKKSAKQNFPLRYFAEKKEGKLFMA
jgi:hypothetical protein